MTPRISLKEKHILDYAEKVLLEKGYHDVSMDEISTGVGDFRKVYLP